MMVLSWKKPTPWTSIVYISHMDSVGRAEIWRPIKGAATVLRPPGILHLMVGSKITILAPSYTSSPCWRDIRIREPKDVNIVVVLFVRLWAKVIG